jgi:hypothetical protein
MLIATGAPMTWVTGGDRAMAGKIQLTQEQLADMRSRIESEYRKDMEALQRLARFLPGGPPVAAAAATPAIRAASEAEEESEETQIDVMLAILTKNFGRTYTVREVYDELRRQRVAMNSDEAQALRTTGNAMIRLAKRRRIRVVRRGKGRQPTVYQGVPPLGMASALEAGMVTQ